MAEDEKKENALNKILYIGADDSFFHNIRDKFKHIYSSIDVDFEKLVSDDPKVLQSFILTIVEYKPKIVLIDFSKNEKAMLHVARIWSRQNNYIKTPMIGLCDYKQSKSVIIRAIMTTLPSIHVKSTEFESIVHTIALLAYPGKVQDHGFATAELNDQIHSYRPAMLSLINENFIRIESNVLMNAKQVLRLNNYWERNKITRSNLVMCVDQSQENIYYNYKFTQVLQMAHADPVEQTDNMTKADFDERQARRQQIVEESRYKLKKWLVDNAGNSRPKFMKAYVIDKTLCFYDNKPLTDSYDFVFRVQPFIANAKKEITNIKPHLIIYSIESVDKETLEANADIAHTFNDTRMLQHLVKTVKEVCTERPPIIVVFNAGEHDSAHMQKVLNYNSILAVKEEMTVELSIKMGEMLKTKIAPTLPQPKKFDVYIDKGTDLSYAEIESDITLIACSENDVFFNSEEPLEIGAVLRISLPVPMYLTVVEMPEYAKISSQYYGVIHGIGEEERKELRRFINSIFFRSLDSEKAADKAQQDKIKQDYLDKVKAQQEKAQADAEADSGEAQKAKEQETEDKAREIVESGLKEE